jgi:hypothetical protein
MADITKETLCLKVVKDVLDELNSISYIFGQQIAVVQSMVDDIKVQRAHEEKKKNSSTAGALRESNEGNARSQSNPPIAESSHSPRSYPLVDNVETTHGGRVQDSIEDSPEDIELKYTQTLTTLTRRNGDIESLKARAHRVYKDVRHKFGPRCHMISHLTVNSCATFSISSRSRPACPRPYLRGKRPRRQPNKGRRFCSSLLSLLSS